LWIRPTYNGGFGNFLIAHERAFDFRRADPVSGHVQHVINPADDPEVAVFVLARAVAREITPFHFAPVSLLVALRITPKTAQHARPGLANHELATRICRDRLTFAVHDFRDPATEGQ